jgi:hypothetical protein
MQTTYPEALTPLGIRRDEPGSKAKHGGCAVLRAIQAAKVALPQSTRPPRSEASTAATREARVLHRLADITGMESDYARELTPDWRARARVIQQETPRHGS